MPKWVIRSACLFSILGATLNAFKIRECFYIWLVTNTVLLVYNWKIKEYWQALIWFSYLTITIIGLIVWGNHG